MKNTIKNQVIDKMDLNNNKEDPMANLSKRSKTSCQIILKIWYKLTITLLLNLLMLLNSDIIEMRTKMILTLKEKITIINHKIDIIKTTTTMKMMMM